MTTFEETFMDIMTKDEDDDLPKQVDIRTASFRILHKSPGHTIYGIWINGGKAGDLTVANSEVVAFEILLERAGFKHLAL